MVNEEDIPVAALREAARRPEVIEAMRQFFADADAAIAAHKPTCWNRGACCRFGEFGHRLYVTALEVVHYLALDEIAPGEATAPAIHDDACPHAIAGTCHARHRRPLGCRVFYCDPAAQFWQGPLTEEMLVRLRDLHQRFDVPYFYADWLAVLRAIGRTAPDAPPGSQ